MVTLDGVAELALALPEVVEGERHGNRAWSIRSRTFLWERPFSKADIRRFADAPPPDGPIVAVRVADLHEKEAVLASGRRGFFTIPHFENYPAVLLHLRVVSRRSLQAAVLDGWLACAPAEVASAHLRTVRPT